MKRIMIVLMMAVAVTACEKATTTVEPAGVFKGTFQRMGVMTGGVANVTLTFSGSQFTGQSDSPRYPAIGTGNFEAKADSVSFTNTSVWTADFDWSLILNGKYKVIVKGDSLELRKYYNGIAYMEDVYKLKKQ